MKTYRCQCEQTLFFDSVQCVNCGRLTAYCTACNQVTSLEKEGENRYRCPHEGCSKVLKLCSNRTEFGVCNAALPTDESDEQLCRFCRLNEIIPDVSVPGNLENWRRLEVAKRRVLVGVLSIGLPLEVPRQNGGPTLKFRFKSDAAGPVSTGHANGCITINLSEADSVHRERTRVQFGEPQRTLVGHFRHELGHYYWELLVEPYDLEAFREEFGNEQEPSYSQAQERYYKQGPPNNWSDSFISAYAGMHPWEDFAETFAAYLDMMAIVETARHFDRTEVQAVPTDFDQMLAAYRDIGIVANEFNREMGLLDLVPEVVTAAVIAKLNFIHQMCVSRDPLPVK